MARSVRRLSQLTPKLTRPDRRDQLREAAERLGESPTRPPYEEVDIAPSSTTICRYLGSWNDAEEQAGLETYGYGKGGGIDACIVVCANCHRKLHYDAPFDDRESDTV